jgi:hypothetical protein
LPRNSADSAAAGALCRWKYSPVPSFAFNVTPYISDAIVQYSPYPMTYVRCRRNTRCRMASVSLSPWRSLHDANATTAALKP